MLSRVISGLVVLYQVLILIRVILSWVNANPYQPVVAHPMVRILHQVTEPILAPLRRMIPPLGGTLDISPIVAMLALELVRWILTSILLNLA
jgi:YggT family protein